MTILIHCISHYGDIMMHNTYDTIMKSKLFIEAVERHRKEQMMMMMMKRAEEYDNIWHYFLTVKIEENTGTTMLKDSSGQYNRKFVFNLVREFITEIMSVQEKDDVGKHIQSMMSRYGEEQVHQWIQIASKEIVRKVRREIDTTSEFDDDDDDDNRLNSTVEQNIKIACENQKDHIMKNIIEPYLQFREDNES